MPALPTVAAQLDGWRLTDERVETVFQLPAARVVGATREYEDERTRAVVRAATDGDLDHRWRFFTATRLGFDPPLPPGTPLSAILPMVRSEARRSFRQRLTDSGLTGVEHRRSERVRIRSGNRARLFQYDAADPALEPPLPVSGWVGVWAAGGDFFVATGGYPDAVLRELLDLADSVDASVADGPGGAESESGADPALDRIPGEARDELLELFRSVR